jgi:glyoxylase-like metal-dependent hydrolase (beta-lactamase superfamily II)
MLEVIPGIFHLPLPIPNPGLDHVNTYLVQADGDFLLIDTGWDTPEVFGSLKSQLTEIGVSFEDISRIVITHIHVDHYGLAGRLKQLSRAEIAFHYMEKDFVKSRYGDMDGLLHQISQWLHINGVPGDELLQLKTASVAMRKLATPTLPDVTLRGGEVIDFGSFSFHVLWTPGHAPGHISLYEPQRKVLISGDYILPAITPNIGLHPQNSGNPLNDYLNSLNTIKQLEVDLILPGHEQPFTGLKQRIEQLIQHHDERNSEILMALDAKVKTAYQIATGITWMRDVGGAGWDDLGAWDKRMAVHETLSHLEAMRTTGKIDKFVRDDIIYFRLA